MIWPFQKHSPEREAAEEIESHIAERADILETEGLSRREAELQARREFGNVTLLTEDSRTVWRIPWLDHLRQDLNFAWRLIRKSPLFAAVAIGLLAVAIGANTAIFGVMKALLLNPLPFREPARVTFLWTEDATRGIHEEGTAFLTIEEWKRRSHSFEDIALASRGFPVFLTGREPTERIPSELVSANFFPLVGATPLIGRVFTAEEELHRDRVVVLSFTSWQRLFGGSNDALLKSLEIDGIGHRVIGVMPQGFFFPNPAASLWRPATLDPARDRQKTRRHTDWWRAVGRLKPGISVAQAQSEMNAIGEQLEREFHSNDPGFAGFGVNVVPALDQIIGRQTRFQLWLVLASGLVLLLLACTNIGQLMLARGAARTQEFALRRALGAGREPLVRQLLTEGVLLAALGCVLGGWLACQLVHVLLVVAPPGIPRLDQVVMDWGVVSFTAAIGALAALLLGLAPAAQVSARVHARSPRRTHAVLLACELALGVVLLHGSVLLVRSYVQVQHADLGFAADPVLKARVDLSAANTTRNDFVPALLDRVKSLPGVVDAGAVNAFFIDWNPDDVITTEDPSPISASESSNQLDRVYATPGYLKAMGVPLLAGRPLAGGEPNTTLVNLEFARRYWPNDSNPIGRRFKDGPPESRHPWLTVVGLVANTRRQGREAPPYP